MSKQLYEEAIADLKKVKEIAEDNAKRAIVEAVAPRIRELIEKELLGESLDEESSDEPHVHGDELPPGAKILKGEKEPSESEDDALETVSFSELAAAVQKDDTNEIDHSSSPANVNEMEQRLLYVEKMLETLSSTSPVSESIESDISHVNDVIDTIYSYLQESVEDPAARLGYGLKLRNYLEKIEKLQETTMKKNLLGEEKVRIELDLPGVDLADSLEDAAVELVLDEEGEAEGEGMDMEMEPEAGEEAPEASEPEAPEAPEEEGLLEVSDLSDDTVVEIDESMLRNEIALMKILREAEEDKNAEEGHAPGAKEFDDFGGASEEGEPLDMDLSEAYDLDEVDMDEMMKHHMDEVDMDEAYMDEMGMHPMDEEEEKKDAPKAKAADPTMPASGEGGAAENVNEDDDLEEAEHLGQADDKSSLGGNYEEEAPAHSGQSRSPLANEAVRSKMAAELKLQESLRKRASQLKKIYEASKKQASSAKTLLERKEASSRNVEIKDAYSKTAERYNASVSRFNKLSQSLSEGSVKRAVSNSGAKSAASTDQIEMLSKKLAETNLFNAKLLFTNKLLQNESLTSRQKSQVIEQLDAAETIREAKLVYESLAKTLVKPRKTVTESRVIGSSSQITRPASTQTLNEGVEAERWARLAGIK